MSKRKQKDPTGSGDQAAASGAGSKGLVLGIVAAVVVVVAAAVFYSAGRMSPSAPATAGAGDPLASAHSPVLGAADARVHIVEFIDPACETCAVFFPAVKQLMAQNPGRIRLSLRHVPFHAGAEFAVRLLEASRNQNKYWETLETLLASQAQWAPNHTVQPQLVMRAIAGVGLDVQRLMADMESPQVVQRVQKDLRDATTLKVRATPEYFVNGRPLPSFGWQQLQDLVNEEIRKAY